MIKLGDRAKDTISGLSGIVVGITDWLFGCRRVGLQPEKLGKDGKVAETQWFDEAQVSVLQRGVVKGLTPVVATGGPNRHEESR